MYIENWNFFCKALYDVINKDKGENEKITLSDLSRPVLRKLLFGYFVNSYINSVWMTTGPFFSFFSPVYFYCYFLLLFYFYFIYF